MFKWKAAEKLAQPKITEVIAGDELLTTAIVEEAEPPPLPIAEPLADIVKPSVADEGANSSSEAQMPVALPTKEPATDLGVTAAAQKSEFAETPPELGDRYEVIEFIGSGGMGSVWKVYDKQLEGTFAVKVLKPELLADATAVKRFEKEANLASDLTHANIAAIFGPGTDSQGRPFIIMGYVDGESLADILAREGKLSEERALDIFTQICEALSHSHMKGIIHRDIKPSNIIISKTESGGDMVHIVDFGIARCIYDEVTKTQALTKAVDIFGSPRYMSPEQFLGSNVTGQSDIYSLGCVLYEMLTGAPPFTDENPVKLILQQISETPDLSKISMRLQLLLTLCLAKEPEQRVPSVDSLLVRLPSLDSNSFIAAQPANLTHGMLAVILILSYALISTMATGPGYPTSPCSSFLPILVWLYVGSVNRDNAGRSVNYKILELNLFLASIAAVVIDCVSSTHIQFISLLVTPFLAVLSLLLIRQPRVIEVYSNCISAISSRIMSCNSRLIIRYEKPIHCIGEVLTCALLALCVLITSVLIVVPTLFVVCASDFGASLLSSIFMPCVALLVFFNFVAVAVRLLDDLTKPDRTTRQSLVLSVGTQATLVVTVLLITLAATSALGGNGFNQLLRQCSAGQLVGQKQKSVRLEALSYPDTLLANDAKLIAASHLWGGNKSSSEALALCNQILESKREKDPVTLASAYALRARIRSSHDRSRVDNADLYKAMSLLEGAQQPSFTDFESNIVRLFEIHLVENEALNLVDLGIRNNDLALSKRALALAKKYGQNDRAYKEQYRKELQATIDAMSAPKPSSAIERR